MLEQPSLSLVPRGPCNMLHCYGIEGTGLRLPLVPGEGRRVFWGGGISGCGECGRQGK